MVSIKYFRLEIEAPLGEVIGRGKAVTIRIITGTKIVCIKEIIKEVEFERIIDHCIAKATHELKEYIKTLKEDEAMQDLTAEEMKAHVDHALDTCFPMVTRYGVLNCQVCVPSKWDDNQVLKYANSAYPCGTNNGWTIRKQGDKALKGADERVPCTTRKDYTHIMLDA